MRLWCSRAGKSHGHAHLACGRLGVGAEEASKIIEGIEQVSYQDHIKRN